MDVHGRLCVQRVQARHGVGEALRRHRAQRMRRQAQPRLAVALRGQAPEQREHGAGLMQEAALIGHRGLVAEAGRLVQHRQQRDADAGGLRGAQQAQRHLGRVGVRLAVRVVMHVMEFANAGVARAQHLDIELRGDGFQRIGREP